MSSRTFRTKRSLALAIVALALAVSAGAAVAQTNTGTTFGSFLEIEPSARLAAMGNAGVSAYDGLASAWYNPASIGRVAATEVTFTHAAWIADITYDYAGVALPCGTWGTAFATLTSLNSGEIDVRTVSQPLGTGERYSVNDLAIAMGFGRQISPRFSAGGQINFVQETIWHTSASTATVSLGTLYRVSEKGLRIGSSLSNFGTRAKFDGRDLRFTYDNVPGSNGDNSTLPGIKYTDSFAVPVTFRVGLAYPFEFSYDQKLLLALDALHPNDNGESMSAGAEYTLADQLALRLGWQNLFLHDTEVGFTSGLGLMGRVDTWRYRCDYGFADHGRLGRSHRVSVGLSF